MALLQERTLIVDQSRFDAALLIAFVARKRTIGLQPSDDFCADTVRIAQTILLSRKQVAS